MAGLAHRAAPLPARDPALASWETLLDDDAMGELVARSLGVAGLAACRPIYVKHKPGHHAFVLYELLADGSGPLLVHAIVAGRRAGRLLSPERLAELTAGDAGPLERPAALVPELGALLLAYPLDLRLLALPRAARFESLRAELHGVVDDGALQGDTELVRYKPERRAVLRAGSVYLKLRGDDRGQLSHALARALAGAGVAAPPALAYLPALRATVTAAAPGTRLKDLRGSGDYARWMEPVVDTLARLHAVPLAGLPERSPLVDAEPETAAAAVAALLPELGPRLASLAGELARALTAAEGGSATLHGSFHDDQVLVSDAGVVLLDLESAGSGPPAADVGHFLAYLSSEGEDEARERFLAACDRRIPGAILDAPLHEAATLLRWATLPFRELEPDWPERVEQRVALAETRLSEHAGRR